MMCAYRVLHEMSDHLPDWLLKGHQGLGYLQYQQCMSCDGLDEECTRYTTKIDGMFVVDVTSPATVAELALFAYIKDGVVR